MDSQANMKISVSNNASYTVFPALQLQYNKRTEGGLHYLSDEDDNNNITSGIPTSFKTRDKPEMFNDHRLQSQ